MDEEVELRVPAATWIVTALLLLVLIVFLATHVHDTEQFLNLARQAKPWWLLVALLLQIGTYICGGVIWNEVMVSAGYRLRRRVLIQLAIEKLSINQLLPAAGAPGNLVVIRGMRRLGIPMVVAMEAMLIEILSYYGAFALLAAAAVWLLRTYDHIPGLLVGLMSFFPVIMSIAPLSILWLLSHRNSPLPAWVKRIKILAPLLEAIGDVSPKRVLSFKLLVTAIGLQIAIFLLDSGTLWATMRSLGTPIAATSAFIGLVLATLAGTVSLLPGGVGGFEAAATALLTFLGAPLGAALAGTLLLRGLTLWLPLVPGIILAQRDLAKRKKPTIPK